MDRNPLAIGLDVCNQGVISIPTHRAVGMPLHRRQPIHTQEEVLHRTPHCLSTAWPICKRVESLGEPGFHIGTDPSLYSQIYRYT